MKRHHAHWLDRLVLRGVRGQPFFREGWGQPGAESQLLQRVQRQAPPRLEVELSPRASLFGQLFEGRFVSPDDTLPEASRVGRVRLRVPRSAADAPVCLFLGGLGDTTWWVREQVVVPLLRQGVGSMLLELPYSGTRATLGSEFGYTSVSEQFRLAGAAVLEAAGLVDWLARRGHRVVLCGFSLGAALAAFTAVRAPRPVNTVLIACGSRGGSAALEGLLGERVCWPALGPRARPRLEACFDAVALERLPRPVDPKTIELIGFSRDGVVSPHQVNALHTHWSGSRLTWVDTGHAAGLFHGAAVIRQALRRAVSTREGGDVLER